MKTQSYSFPSAIHTEPFFEESGTLLHELAKRNQVPLSLALIDIDNLGHINETYGMDYGDKLIEKTAEAISINCRKSDLVGYLGEGKFALILYNITGINADLMLNTLRQKLDHSLNSDDEDSSENKKSVSIGATMIYTHSDTETLDTLYDKAFLATNRAKSSGKDRVVIL